MNRRIVIMAAILIGLAACKSKPKDSVTSGVIAIAVDESFKPILQQEVDVFEGIYSTAGVLPNFVSETEAFNLLFKDSVEMIVTTRGLSQKEIESFNARKLYPKQIKIATDAIALIVHKNNPDTLISVSVLKDILSGKITRWDKVPGVASGEIQLVFDHPSSSTVRYAIDSICKGVPLSGKLFAQKTPDEVIRYVSRNPKAIGVIGVNWIGNKQDSSLLTFSNQIRVMSVSAEYPAGPENSYKPYQAYIALEQYPLRRDVYAILNDPRGGLASGFYTFLCSDRGQRILLKSGLVPATQPLRIVNTNTKSFQYE